MTQQWMVVAEADKIQTFVFRSARLREVAGASQWLSEFCQDAPEEILTQLGDQNTSSVIVADGGSFTVTFTDKTAAKQFGPALAQSYYRKTGATLTYTAEPVAYEGDSDFADKVKDAHRELAAAKRGGHPPRAVAQGPYMAFCASCGIGLAHDHAILPDNAEGDAMDSRGQYVCEACKNKAEKRWKKRGAFLGSFRDAVVGASVQNDDWNFPKDAEQVGAWDPRRYVAYLVADGNNMGLLFGHCQTQEEFQELSKALPRVVRESLAEPTKTMMKEIDTGQQIPMLPLILGGDDVFVLLPATYALDFALKFCAEYEKRMEKALKDIFKDRQPPIRPTLGAAVVICKSSYPYLLAHRRGEYLLKAAKHLSKTVALAKGNEAAHSAVHFDVILGSRLAVTDTASQDYRGSLAPYWVGAPGDPELGLSLETLLEQRLALQSLPKRRLAQLRSLYSAQNLPQDKENVMESGQWLAQLTRILSRVARDSNDLEKLCKALKMLGDADKSGYWQYLNRYEPKSCTFYAHGLPDLLRMWDFSWKLDAPRNAYMERED
ncbi:MAG: hypothetical protein JXA21_00170 [Anaerolineae bacterium]|nr:hypothetical protein [Anaerolineae bacterium]